MSHPKSIIFLILSLVFLATECFAQAEVQIRIMAANITSGNGQSYDAGHGTRIFQGLDPDIVLIQEFNYGNNSASEISNYVSSTFGSSFQYYREGGAQIPNGIISRYPILSSGEWDDPEVSNRDFAWAQIDIPGTPHLWAISVHLLTANAGVRNTEAVALKNFILSKNIPSSDYIVLGGDFNTGSRSESAFGTLSSLFKTSSPHPKDQQGKEGTNATRSKPYDGVYLSHNLVPLQVPTVVGTASFTSGLVFDSRVFSPLSAASPVQSGDSGSSNMQHMAVIKDVAVPVSGTPGGSGGGGGGGGTPDPDPTPGGGVPNGELITDSVAAQQWKYYLVELPSNVSQLTLQMTANGSGDADLYVKKGSQPSTSSYDFRPYLNGSNETVTVSASSTPVVSSGLWHVGVRGYSNAGYKIAFNWTTSSGGSTGGGGTTTPPPPSTGPVVVINEDSSVAQGAWKNYTVTVPSGTTKMTVQLTGTGDADLYIKKESAPTLSSYHFRPYLTGSAETVVVSATSNPTLSAGTYYVSVQGYQASNFHLNVTLE